MHPDVSALASLWVAAVVALFAVLVYAETWRAWKQLRRHRVRMAAVGLRSQPGRTVTTDSWAVRRNLAVEEVRERQRLRRLRGVSAAVTGAMILSITQVATTLPMDPTSLLGR